MSRPQTAEETTINLLKTWMIMAISINTPIILSSIIKNFEELFLSDIP